MAASGVSVCFAIDIIPAADSSASRFYSYWDKRERYVQLHCGQFYDIYYLNLILFNGFISFDKENV